MKEGLAVVAIHFQVWPHSFKMSQFMTVQLRIISPKDCSAENISIHWLCSWIRRETQNVLITLFSWIRREILPFLRSWIPCSTFCPLGRLQSLHLKDFRCFNRIIIVLSHSLLLVSFWVRNQFISKLKTISCSCPRWPVNASLMISKLKTQFHVAVLFDEPNQPSKLLLLRGISHHPCL